MTHPGEPYERFEMALQAWDNHMARCRRCLSAERAYCDDGIYFAYDVSRARVEIETYESRQSRRTNGRGRHRFAGIASV